MIWNYILGHYWCGEKLLRQLLGWKLEGVTEKAVEKSTEHRHKYEH